jgi:uncharacterized protein YdhG (YjbR/CyaY superfamily)
MKKPNNISEYVATFPSGTQKILEQVHSAIKETVPQAQEVISYSMPAFKMNKVVICFAGYKNHIGLYPGSKAVAHFQKDFAKYKTSKGAVQFPLDKPMPLTLIKRIVKFNVKQDSVTTK